MCDRETSTKRGGPGPYRAVEPYKKKRPVRTADNLTTFMYQFSINLGASTSWNPKGLSRFVMRLFYVFLFSQLRAGGHVKYLFYRDETFILPGKQMG
jgi:hypothetical protein